MNKQNNVGHVAKKNGPLTVPLATVSVDMQRNCTGEGEFAGKFQGMGKFVRRRIWISGCLPFVRMRGEMLLKNAFESERSVAVIAFERAFACVAASVSL